MSGYTANELTGMNVLELTAPEDRARILEKMRTNSAAPYEARARRKDGSTFPVEVLGRTVSYEGRTVRVAALRDVSLRRAAELALEEKRRELERANRALEEANRRKNRCSRLCVARTPHAAGRGSGFCRTLATRAGGASE